ncbi:hypothetical protein GLOIN_2v1791364 [Rhizophagus irregularis DAOM 181602=DAOM 197198]|uniref:Uncharacterized protein n=1 Tax=Rhizophagus irregularis (strain DAOM 181602 / DAOM 197198 / MUCL 43194) TaxID=747089 RepID=A0A2P4NX73_RHIID|nr:hypothetical protein GLOIN_2v1791364 [Rhizophagus irregularis DAOM 181602=DAOM 197198]POG57742.1 hypothetical protein GLOIN_2v1791364 [Rhizophagus irregularis DAOM 181602=DAOM 197198]|eukprot:XP_025164608.1 hypothetical protein GLOIN_2v1791364 [Rhizophagus irregularis DAOM 181602=DAOM 197198]
MEYDEEELIKYYFLILVKKLQSRGIELNGKENKEELVINLDKELNKEVERKKLEPERIVGVLVDVTNSQTIRCISTANRLGSKEEPKFGKKGAGKRMTNQVRALLEGYFMAGNADKSNRYTTQDMQRELEKCAQEGEIDKDDIPKVTTIQNWISKTTREHREEAATRKPSRCFKTDETSRKKPSRRFETDKTSQKEPSRHFETDEMSRKDPQDASKLTKRLGRTQDASKLTKRLGRTPSSGW